MKTIRLKRPNLTRIKLDDAIQSITNGNSRFVFTISPGYWDNLLDEAYFRQDAILIEVDKSESPIAAYKLKNDK